MKNKKLLVAVIALIAVVAVMLGIWLSSRPQPEMNDAPDENQTQDQTGEVTGETDGEETTEAEFEKYFTVEVVHADGTTKTFTYGTNEDYLGPVLVEAGLIVESDSPGMYNTVDGETADWNVNQSYWGFYVNGEYAMVGMDDQLITDGDVYKLEYTLG